MSEVRHALCQPCLAWQPGPLVAQCKDLFGAGGERRSIDGHMDRYARTHARENSPLFDKGQCVIFNQGGQQTWPRLNDLTTHAANAHASLTQPNSGIRKVGVLLCPANGPRASRLSQVRSVRSGQARSKPTPTHQQIGLLNRLLSTRVGQNGDSGRRIWSVDIPPAPGEEGPVSRKSSSDSDGPRRDHRPSRGPSGGWRKEAVIEFSLENLNRILHGSTDLCDV